MPCVCMGAPARFVEPWDKKPSLDYYEHLRRRPILFPGVTFSFRVSMDRTYAASLSSQPLCDGIHE